MKKATIIWLLVAVSLVLVGCILWSGITNTQSFETNQHAISQKFHNIYIEADTANISFVLSNTESSTIECYEDSKEKHTVTVENDTLVIRTINNKAWYDYIGIHFDSPKITLTLPQSAYASLCVEGSTAAIKIPEAFHFEDAQISLSTGDVRFSAAIEEALKIKTSTGKICVENTSAGSLDLGASTGSITVSDVVCRGDAAMAVSTGRTTLSNLQCQNLTSTGDTGDLSLQNVIAADKFHIERDTGDVKFESADAAEIFVKTDTGDVTGSLLTEKIFYAQSDTGWVRVPKSTTGGICEITTDTGDIRITLK